MSTYMRQLLLTILVLTTTACDPNILAAPTDSMHAPKRPTHPDPCGPQTPEDAGLQSGDRG